MGEFFVRLYRYFSRHKIGMGILLGVSTLVFLAAGLRMHYEEDISKLVPSSDDSESELAFNSLRVKDKIFLQFVPRNADGEAVLCDCVDSFMESLVAQDSTDRLIADVLYRLDAATALGALDYVLDHLPSFVDTSAYAKFDKRLEAADEAMARNRAAMMADETGSVTQMVTMDPLELRKDILPAEGLTGNGFTLKDGHLFSATGGTALAFLSPVFSYQNSQACETLVGRIERQIQSFADTYPDVRVLVHGAPVRSVGNARAIKKDLLLTIVISLAAILLVLCLSFRSFRMVWQILLPLSYGTAFALAVLFWIKGSMSLMAFGICAVVLGVAISYCLHLLIHHRFVGDVEQLLRDEAKPICLGCLTTVGAFLGLLFTKSELLRDFGIFATLALLGSTFFVLVFLPHFLKPGDTRKNLRILGLVDRINGFPYDRNPLFLSILTVFIIVAIAFSPRVEFDSDLRHIGYDAPEMLEAQALYAAQNFGGLTQRYYAAAGTTLDEALRNHRNVRAVIDSLVTAGEAVSGSDIASLLFVPEDVQRERIAAWQQWWAEGHLDAARKAVSAAARRQGLDPDLFRGFYAMAEMPYEPDNLYESGIIPEGLLSNFVEESGDRYLIFSPVRLREEDRDKVDDAIAAVPHAVVIDPIYYTGNLVDLTHRDFNAALLISSLFVLVVLLLSLRRIWTALLAFLPMALSWYVVQGVMAMTGLEFNLINIVISTFIFGIGVDYSIFVMQGLIAGANGNDDRLLNWHKTAIFFSAFVLIAVIVVLLFARHPAIRSIGYCSLIGMVTTILISYSLQPFLFRWLQRHLHLKAGSR